MSVLDFLSVLEDGLDSDVDSDDVETLAGGVAPSSLSLLLSVTTEGRVWGFLYPCMEPEPLEMVLWGEPGALVARDELLESILPSTTESQES